MADIQYFSGVPEVGVVPRAPWSDYTTNPKFAYDPARLDDVRTLAERLGGARDTLRPPTV